MAQQFDNPQTETQLREIQDKLYQHSKEVHNAGGRPAFNGSLKSCQQKQPSQQQSTTSNATMAVRLPAWIPKPCEKIICNVPIRG